MRDVKKIERPERKFLPENFKVENWSSLKPLFEDLLERSIHSVDTLKEWLKDRSELEAVISEDLAWRSSRAMRGRTGKRGSCETSGAQNSDGTPR
jgi:oligoendopeptidase F